MWTTLPTDPTWHEDFRWQVSVIWPTDFCWWLKLNIQSYWQNWILPVFALETDKMKEEITSSREPESEENIHFISSPNCKYKFWDCGTQMKKTYEFWFPFSAQVWNPDQGG